jgi:hypothetical protein
MVVMRKSVTLRLGLKCVSSSSFIWGFKRDESNLDDKKEPIVDEVNPADDAVVTLESINRTIQMNNKVGGGAYLDEDELVTLDSEPIDVPVVVKVAPPAETTHEQALEIAGGAEEH